MKKKIYLGVVLACLLLFNTPMAQANENCCEQDSCGFFSVGGDWLYWKVEQDQMEVAAHVTITTDNVTTFIHSKVLEPRFHTTSGYRAFVNYMTPDRKWKIEACFTHQPTNAGFIHIVDPGDIATDFISLYNTNFPLLTPIAGNSFSSLSSKWNAKIDYFDLDLSRAFFFLSCFEIEPHLGLRGLLFDQKFRIDGTNGASFSSNMKASLKGGGIEGGLWGKVTVPYGFALVGHIGGSLLYVKSQNNGGVIIFGEDSDLDITYDNNSYFTIPTVDSFIGITFDQTICHIGINIHVGWEQHVFFNTNRFSLSRGSNLTMQGLTLGGAITY